MVKGTQTEKNLLKAFAGESQARNRYTFFSSIAKKEGYEQIAAIFQETADNEKEHAEIFFKHLVGGALEINASFPANGEKEEWSKLYPSFEKVAGEEGFPAVAASFKEIAEVEEHHEQRYRQLLTNIEQNKVFSKGSQVKWKCRNCGYVHEGKDAPLVCPACKHPQAYYELLADNF